jgi:hypothetical protein
MDDYRTRRLDADFEDPDSEDEEREEEEQGQFMTPPLLPTEEEAPPPFPPTEEETPPPLPPTEEETPPPLPVMEDEDVPEYRQHDIVTPPPVPDEEEEEASKSPIVYFDTPSAPYESGGGQTVIGSSSSWYGDEQPRATQVPSPFEEPVITPEPSRGAQARPITPEVVPSGRGGGTQAPPPSGTGTPPKKNQTPLIIGIVVAVLLLLCCCCILAVIGFSWLDSSGFMPIASLVPNLLL